MSTPQNTRAYIVMPVNKPPEETGWYYVLNANREILPRMDRCVTGKWDNNNKLLIFYWLRPIDLSRMLADCWEAALDEGDSNNPTKSQYINSILNPK